MLIWYQLTLHLFNQNKASTLHVAVDTGNVENIQLLIAAGVYVNLQNVVRYLC